MSRNIEKMMVSPVFEKIRIKHSGSPKTRDYHKSQRQVRRKIKYKRQERALLYGQTT